MVPVEIESPGKRIAAKPRAPGQLAFATCAAAPASFSAAVCADSQASFTPKKLSVDCPQSGHMTTVSISSPGHSGFPFRSVKLNQVSGSLSNSPRRPHFLQTMSMEVNAAYSLTWNAANHELWLLGRCWQCKWFCIYCLILITVSINSGMKL